MAAYIIGYAPKKRLVVDDLQQAVQDPDDAVRNNAIRAPRRDRGPGRIDPDLEIHISPTWFASKC